SVEQSSGIEQVNQAITQMDQVTQQNAALVEQAAAASESMREQAGALAQAIATFKPSPSEAQLEAAPAWSGEEPRSPNRAVTVARLAPAAAKPATRIVAAARSTPATATGTDGDWEQF